MREIWHVVCTRLPIFDCLDVLSWVHEQRGTWLAWGAVGSQACRCMQSSSAEHATPYSQITRDDCYTPCHTYLGCPVSKVRPKYKSHMNSLCFTAMPSQKHGVHERLDTRPMLTTYPTDPARMRCLTPARPALTTYPTNPSASGMTFKGGSFFGMKKLREASPCMPTIVKACDGDRRPSSSCPHNRGHMHSRRCICIAPEKGAFAACMLLPSKGRVHLQQMCAYLF